MDDALVEHPVDRRTYVEVHGPGGWWGRVTGMNLRDFLIVILIMFSCGFVWYSEEKRSKTYLEQHKITQTLLSTVVANQALIINSIERHTKEATENSRVVSYIMTLSQPRREALNLSMPYSLRQQILDRQ